MTYILKPDRWAVTGRGLVEGTCEFSIFIVINVSEPVTDKC